MTAKHAADQPASHPLEATDHRPDPIEPNPVDEGARYGAIQGVMDEQPALDPSLSPDPVLIAQQQIAVKREHLANEIIADQTIRVRANERIKRSRAEIANLDRILGSFKPRQRKATTDG